RAKFPVPGMPTRSGCWKCWAPSRKSITGRSAGGCSRRRNGSWAAGQRSGSVDNQLIPRGLRRAPARQFLLWLLPWIVLLLFGLYSIGLCLVKGLNQTHMDNRFAFGLWIFLDLTVIALGAGAFFTGFLLYIL